MAGRPKKNAEKSVDEIRQERLKAKKKEALRKTEIVKEWECVLNGRKTKKEC